MELLGKAKDLEGIRRVCRPAPLDGKELESFFVETDMARDPHQKTRKRLIEALLMIKVTDPEGQPAPGFDTVKRIIMQRIEDNLIKEDALDRLVTMTGGVLRHAFDVLHTAVVMNNARVPKE